MYVMSTITERMEKKEKEKRNKQTNSASDRKRKGPFSNVFIGSYTTVLFVWPIWDQIGLFYLQVLGMFASSYMIVAMTVDRHYAICCPLQAHRSGATKRWNSFIVLAWVLSLLLSLPQVFIFSRSELAPGVYECWGNFAESWGLKAYVTWMTLAIFVLPVLIITICQVRIFKEIHNNLYLKSDCRLCPAALPQLRKETQRGKRGGGEGKGGEVTAAMSKTVRMTLVIVLVYSLCWAPFFSVQLWAAWDPDPPQNGTHTHTHTHTHARTVLPDQLDVILRIFLFSTSAVSNLFCATDRFMPDNIFHRPAFTVLRINTTK
uniref:Arginine vasopressin receptor 2 n=1 Tax=Neolamprologus brichardi TaxID=32507 RepID=A0A3Q4I4V2_NEOBR